MGNIKTVQDIFGQKVFGNHAMLLLMMNRIVSFLLIALNAGIFIWMVVKGISIFNPSPQELIAWGGNFNEALLQGQWWRLFSCMFLHAGILHLLMNMYALNYVGGLLEPALGKTRFLIAYLASGLIASLVSAVFHANTFIVGVGASGAIFGLFGVLFALISTKYFDSAIREALGKSIATTLVINLAYGFQGGIDLAAHLGGLVAGFVIGYCLYLSMTTARKVASFLLVAIVVAGTMMIGIIQLRDINTLSFHRLRDELAIYEHEMQHWVSAIQSKTVWEAKIDLDQLILPGWKKMKAIADQMKQLELSGQKANARNYMVELTYLQAEKFDLITRSIEEESESYDERIRQIDRTISETY